MANSGDGTVSVINGATCNAHRHSGCGQKAPKVEVGGLPFALAVDQATDTIYVTNGFNSDGSFGHTVSVINGATCNGSKHSGCGRTPVTTKVGPFPFGLAANQATNTVYVANNNNGDGPASLSVIDGSTCDGTNTTGCGTTWPAQPGIGRAPIWVAFDPSTHTVYTANFSDAAVSVVNAAPAAIHHPASRPPTVATSSAPFPIAIDHGNRTIYVCNNLDGTISILPEQPVRALANIPLQATRPTAASVRLGHRGGLSMRPVPARQEPVGGEYAG